MLDQVKSWARTVKRDVTALYFAARDPRTPKAAKIIAIIVLAYALSPIDLIPDFIPVLGLLDDIILIPLGIMLVVRLIPAELIAEYRIEAAELGQLPKNNMAAAVIIAIWVMSAAAFVWWLSHRFYLR